MNGERGSGFHVFVMKPFSIIIAGVALVAFLAVFLFVRSEQGADQDQQEQDEVPEGRGIDHPGDSVRRGASPTNGMDTLLTQREQLRVVYADGKIPAPEDLKGPAAGLIDTGEDDTTRNEEANRLRKQGYRGLTDDLIKVLNNPAEKERFRSWAVQHLYHNYPKADQQERKKIMAVLRQALQDPHVSVRREALLATHELGDAGASGLALKWLHDENTDNVRDTAIRVIREREMMSEIETIRRLAHHPDTVIRIAAIVTLAHWQDDESRPIFQAAAGSKVPRLQRAGIAALTRLDQK